MESLNIPIREDIQTINQLKQIIEKLRMENQELQSRQVDQNLLNLKEQIANEFEQLRLKNEEYSSNLLLLNTKESAIIKKELEVKQLQQYYDQLSRIQNVQLEVTNLENKSQYTFNLVQPIQKVISIKLVSYYLPEPKYNIESNKNNTLIFKVNGEDHKIEINIGLYSISELLNEINNKLEDLSINLLLNNEQKVVIHSENTFEMVSTNMLKDNLGFTLNNYNNDKMYVANRVWDLRKENKVYLYLSNLSDNPFGVLYFNNISSCQFRFQNPYNLNKLDIILKDSKGNLYNLYDLSHYLSFVVEKVD